MHYVKGDSIFFFNIYLREREYMSRVRGIEGG